MAAPKQIVRSVPSPKVILKGEKAELGLLLCRRESAKDAATKADLETHLARLVARGTRTIVEDDGPERLAVIAQGLRDLARAGKYGDWLNPSEAVALAAKNAGVRCDDVPEAIVQRLARLT